MSYWQTKFRIGNLEFPRFVGGPLDGITDSPFRKLVRDFSQDELLYTEMRHVACVANDKGALKSLKFEQHERPLNYQVAANKLDCIDQAVEKILAAGIDIVDLNIGCPAKNVIRSGSGSALMADPERLEKILKRFRALLPIPFTVKIRAGFKEKNAIDIARLIQDCGADAIAIHPRLQTQYFEGRPDYSLAGDVKKALNIPVILSGNVINFTTAKLAYEQTGVDAFLIGRGIWAKPWKLKEMHEHANGREFKVDNATILKYALKHLDGILEYYGRSGLYMYRKHLPFYVKGIPAASQLRKELVTSESVDQIKEGLVNFFNQIDTPVQSPYIIAPENAMSAER